MTGDRMLQVLMLTPSASRAGGGVAVAVRNLARLLADRPGIEVRVEAIVDAPLAPDEAEEWAGIAVTRHAVIGPRSYGFAPGLLRAALRARPDLIHVHGVWQFQCFVALVVNLLRGTPIVVTPHGMLERWILANSRRLKAAVSRLYQDRFLRRARLIHILTGQEREDVARKVPGGRCRLIPNAVETPELPARRPGWWRAAFDGRDVFLFLGRLHRKKGCEALCDAWEVACEADPDFRDRSALVFCGPADGIPGLDARVAGLDARFGNALAAGPQFGEDKLASLGAASFLCLPSHSEGLPITVLEAWAAGLPAIMTPECNLPIGFERGAAIATTTSPCDIAASLRAAGRLSGAEHAAMAAAGREIVAERFAPKVVGDEWIALYQAVATNQKGTKHLTQ